MTITKGSEFAVGVDFVDSDAWEAAILAARDSWIVWPMVDVAVPDAAGHGAVIGVSANFFAIGEPDDYVFIPMRGTTAQKIADDLGLLLPTKRIIDLSFAAAGRQLVPSPKPEVVGTRRQVSAAAAREHSATVQAQMGGPLDGVLVRGHKKNAGVLTNRLALRPEQLSIYGWHTPINLPIGNPPVRAGQPIQPLSLLHEFRYADYSHGVTFVAPTMQLGGDTVQTVDVLASPLHANLLSDEGPLRVLRIPDVHARELATTQPAPTASATLRRGSAGVAVRQLQGWLKALGASCSVDGSFGPDTEAAVRAFQGDHGLVVDGAVGPATMTMLRQLVTNTPTVAPEPRATLPGAAMVPFVQAAHFTRGRYGTAIRLAVIHTTENTQAPGVEDAVASWFAGASAPQASAHYVIGQHVVQCVREVDMAWHAPAANAQGIGIEHVGRAAFTATDWASDYSTAMLDVSAKLVADICQRHGLPAVFVDADGLLAGESGITTHAEVAKAWHRTDHFDPGQNWPMDDYIGRVQAFMP